MYKIKEIFFMKPHHQHRAVVKISSCPVYVISRRGIVQLGSSFGSIFLLFPMRVVGAHAHSRRGKSLLVPVS